jgi:NAD(P)-dependent dehydrogenase (short-subunit alcohol dehydrogenase family)
MDILIIGGQGTIGRHLTSTFAQEHHVITASRSSGQFSVDIADAGSIHAMFELTGKVDAIVCCAGEAKWATMDDLTEDDYYVGIRSKLMGQVNLVRIGRSFLNKNGSVTLTTGILADDPVLQTTSASMVNGAIHSFVRAAALEMENGIRINAVSCGMVEDAYEKYKNYFPGHVPISMPEVIKAYERAIIGAHTGEVITRY